MAIEFERRQIDDFKARLAGGGARPNLFEVELSFPDWGEICSEFVSFARARPSFRVVKTYTNSRSALREATRHAASNELENRLENRSQMSSGALVAKNLYQKTFSG